MFVYNILIMEKPIKFNIDNNPYYSNKKEIEQVNELLAKKTKEFNERFFKEHDIPNSLLKEKGKLILIPNPNLDNSWLENFKNTPLSFGKAEEVATCNGKDFDFLFTFNGIKPIDSEIAIDSSFRKLQELKNAYEKTIHQAHSIADIEWFTIYTSIDNVKEIEKKVNDAFKKTYPLTPDECFKKEDWLNNKKHILVITLPSNFLSILKILKINKEQYFTLYKDKWSLKEKSFDAIVVDSSMPYHLEFYNSIKKYIKYKVPTYLLEKEALKTIK